MDAARFVKACARFRRFVAPLQVIAAYAAVLVAWQLIAMRSDPDVSVARIVETMWSYYPSHEFVGSVISTLARIAMGYALAALVGVSVGILLGLNRWLNDIFDPLWSLLRPVAPLAWVPITIVWFGIGEKAAVFVIAFTVFFPIMLNTAQGIREASPIYREAALTLGARPLNIILEVSLPAALPSILNGLRVGMALSFAVIVAAELVIGFSLHSGLGYLMVKYTQFTFSLPLVIAIVTAVGVFGLVADQILVRLMNWATPWRPSIRA
jgi:ABC-type nitrate/sulfonate/bicarbonate transport system permease component